MRELSDLDVAADQIALPGVVLSNQVFEMRNSVALCPTAAARRAGVRFRSLTPLLGFHLSEMVARDRIEPSTPGFSVAEVVGVGFDIN